MEDTRAGAKTPKDRLKTEIKALTARLMVYPGLKTTARLDIAFNGKETERLPTKLDVTSAVGRTTSLPTALRHSGFNSTSQGTGHAHL
jgi:hypothetical protein